MRPLSTQGDNMLNQLLTFLGSIINMLVDTVYKVGVAIMFVFLIAIALATGFAVLIIALIS